MIVCAQCGKKNKDDATVCKYCGYNPSAVRANNQAWAYQNAMYPPMPYQPPIQQGGCYYDANGKAYSVRYDCKVTPMDEGEVNESDGAVHQQQMLLYPYNPTLMQMQQPQQVQQQEAKEKKEKKPNLMAWIGYILAMFFDIFAWPFCAIGLVVANKRDGAKRELCIGGMLFTLLRVITLLCLFLVWKGMHAYIPQFFVGINTFKAAFAKMVMFGWPIAVGSIFSQVSAPDSALRAAGKGYLIFSIVLAVAGIIFLDISILPIFS